MAKNLDKEGLCSIVDNYQLFYIDLWGVVHNGISLHQEAINTLKEISKKGKEYILLTNAPRPNKVVKTFLEKMGMEKEIRERVFTSGEASLRYLSRNLIDKKFFHVGPPRDIDLFKDFKLYSSVSILILLLLFKQSLAISKIFFCSISKFFLFFLSSLF